MTTSFDFSNIAEVELIYSTKVRPSERPKISTSKEAYEILRQAWNQDKIELREEMKVEVKKFVHCDSMFPLKF